MSSPSFPEPPRQLPETTEQEIDQALTRLTKSKAAWLQVSTEKRRVLLQECLKDLMTLSEEWIAQSCKGKGLERGSVGEGEEWVGSFSIVVRGIQLMIEALKANGQPKIPSTRTRADGQIIANVYPRNFLEKVMLENVFRCDPISGTECEQFRQDICSCDIYAWNDLIPLWPRLT